MKRHVSRVLFLLSMGGATLAVGFLPTACHPFAENGPYTQFVEDVGSVVVGEGVGNMLAPLPDDLDWLGTPVTKLYQRLWVGYVRTSFAQDPVYNVLLRD